MSPVICGGRRVAVVTELELMLNQLVFFFFLLLRNSFSNLVDLTRLKRTGLMLR